MNILNSCLARIYSLPLFQENVTLIKEINDLRSELKTSRTQVHELEASINTMRKHGDFSLKDPTSHIEEKAEVEAYKLIDLQKQEMRRLRAQIVDFEAKIAERPPSGRLPPLIA